MQQHRRSRLFSFPAHTLTVCIGITATSLTARAAEFNYGVGYSAEYSTNINAVPTNPRSEWINALTGHVSYAENTESLVARATAEVQYRDYAKDVVPDETLYLVDASAVWSISPRRFTWTVEDVARQMRLNPTGPDISTNRTGANVFRTGPDLYFHPGGSHTISVGARYANLYAGDTTDIDNQSYTGSVRWLYQWDPQTTWSLNGQRQHVEFDNDVLNQNFWRNDAYLQLEKNFPQSRLVLLGGTTRIQPERSPDRVGSLASMIWTHNISADATLGVSASIGYQDAATQLISTVSAPTAPLVPIAAASIGTDAASSDFFYNRYYDVFYTLRSSRMEYRLRASQRELDYQTTLQDRTETGGRFEINYLYSLTSTFGIFSNYLKTEFIDVARTDRDTDIGARYGYRMTRNTTLGLEARRHERQSTAEGADYVDNRYLFTVVYSTDPQRLPTSQE